MGSLVRGGASSLLRQHVQRKSCRLGLGDGVGEAARRQQEDVSQGGKSRLQATQEQVPWPRSELEASWSVPGLGRDSL